MAWYPAEKCDRKSPTFPSKTGNVEWMMVIILRLSDEPRKKIQKPQKIENLKKNLKLLIKLFSPFPRPQQTIPPKCSSGSYYIAGPSRKREISHCKNLKMDPQKALVQSTIYSHLSYIVLTQLVNLRVAESGDRKLPSLRPKGENVDRPEAIHPY